MESQSRMMAAFGSAGRQTKATFGKLANGGFSTFVKIMMIVVTVYVVCISATNIAAYAYILRQPKADQNVNSTWSITLIILNVILMLCAFAILIIVIISFFRKGGDKVAAVVDDASRQGMMQGVKVAAQVDAAKAAEVAKASAIESGSSVAAAEMTGQDTYRRELIKKIAEYQQKIMGSGMEGGGGMGGSMSSGMGGGMDMMSPSDIDPAQAYRLLQTLGIQLQVPQGYMG